MVLANHRRRNAPTIVPLKNNINIYTIQENFQKKHGSGSLQRIKKIVISYYRIEKISKNQV